MYRNKKKKLHIIFLFKVQLETPHPGTLVETAAVNDDIIFYPLEDGVDYGTSINPKCAEEALTASLHKDRN